MYSHADIYVHADIKLLWTYRETEMTGKLFFTFRLLLLSFLAFLALLAIDVQGGAARAQPPEDPDDDEPIRIETPPAAEKPEPAGDDDREGDADKARETPARLPAGARVLAEARRLLKAKGCPGAAPAYRVAAATGAGMEAAQHELGDCLMEMEGASDIETALFRQEGAFWLVRAAHAGNARAQRRLAMLHASPVGGAHDPAAALRWALVYEKNPRADLYGFGPLPPTMVEGLKRDLPPADAAAAEAFAAGFTALPLAAYAPPTREEVEKRARQRGGQRRRRRLDAAP